MVSDRKALFIYGVNNSFRTTLGALVRLGNYEVVFCFSSTPGRSEMARDFGNNKVIHLTPSTFQLAKLNVDHLDVFYSYSLSPWRLGRETGHEFLLENSIRPASILRAIVPLVQSVRIFNCSTISVYDFTALEGFELRDITRVVEPSASFSYSKLAFERQLLEICEQHPHVNVLNMRLPCVLSQEAQRNFLADFRHTIHRNGRPKLFCSKTLFNSCVSVDQVIHYANEFFGSKRVYKPIINGACKKPLDLCAFMENLGFSFDKASSWNRPEFIINTSTLEGAFSVVPDTVDILTDFFGKPPLVEGQS